MTEICCFPLQPKHQKKKVFTAKATQLASEFSFLTKNKLKKAWEWEGGVPEM